MVLNHIDTVYWPALLARLLGISTYEEVPLKAAAVAVLAASGPACPSVTLL